LLPKTPKPPLKLYIFLFEIPDFYLLMKCCQNSSG